MGIRSQIAFVLIVGLSPQLWAADEKSPFDIDLTPDQSAVQTPAKTQQNPPALTAPPISTAVQNPNPDISFIGDF